MPPSPWTPSRSPPNASNDSPPLVSPAILAAAAAAARSDSVVDSALGVFTTTIFVPAPTTTPDPSSLPLPVGSIVGGLLGGVFLAVVAVVGWIWWGRAIERKIREDQLSRPGSALAVARDPYREGRAAVATGRSRSSLANTNSTNNSRASLAQGSASRYASRRSLQRTPPPFGAVSQKSVSFADDSGGGSQTPSPAGSLRNTTPVPADNEKRSTTERGRVNNNTLPRSAMRSPGTPTRRSQSSERGYAPARPSPLSMTSRGAGPPPTRRVTASFSGRSSPAMSLRAPSPAAMYSRSPTPTGANAGAGGGTTPTRSRTRRRNSAPPAPSSPVQRPGGLDLQPHAPGAVSTPTLDLFTSSSSGVPAAGAGVTKTVGSRLNVFAGVEGGGGTRLSTITDRTSMVTSDIDVRIRS